MAKQINKVRTVRITRLDPAHVLGQMRCAVCGGVKGAEYPPGVLPGACCLLGALRAEARNYEITIRQVQNRHDDVARKALADAAKTASYIGNACDNIVKALDAGKERQPSEAKRYAQTALLGLNGLKLNGNAALAAATLANFIALQDYYLNRPTGPTQVMQGAVQWAINALERLGNQLVESGSELGAVVRAVSDHVTEAKRLASEGEHRTAVIECSKALNGLRALKDEPACIGLVSGERCVRETLMDFRSLQAEAAECSGALESAAFVRNVIVPELETVGEEVTGLLEAASAAECLEYETAGAVSLGVWKAVRNSSKVGSRTKTQIAKFSIKASEGAGVIAAVICENPDLIRFLPGAIRTVPTQTERATIARVAAKAVEKIEAALPAPSGKKGGKKARKAATAAAANG